MVLGNDVKKAIAEQSLMQLLRQNYGYELQLKINTATGVDEKLSENITKQLEANKKAIIVLETEISSLA